MTADFDDLRTMPSPRVAPLLAVNEEIVTAAICTVLAAALGRAVGNGATALDAAFRRSARRPRVRKLRRLTKPLFVLGLPGAYIPLAYSGALWVQHRRRQGGPAIIAAAWLGWLGHRAVKTVYVRARPNGNRPRVDSYPSGHTMGATALSFVIGHVLAREGIVSRRAALAIATALAGAMGASRVLSDDHWITDVVGGWLFGGAVAGLVSAIADYGY